MIGRYRRLAILALLAASSVLATACDATYITEEARSSLASFVTGVITTAVEGAIGP